MRVFLLLSGLKALVLASSMLSLQLSTIFFGGGEAPEWIGTSFELVWLASLVWVVMENDDVAHRMWNDRETGVDANAPREGAPEPGGR